MDEFYCYLRSKGAYGAITSVFVKTADSIDAGFAFCSENDNFCRERGKLIATSRLKVSPVRIAALCCNEKGKLEIVPTLITFLEKVIDGANVEKQLHVRPYGRGKSFNDGDFLPWLQQFVMLIKEEYKISSAE